MNSLSELLAKARYDAGVSQEYMAEELEVSRKTIQNWEKGYGEPKLSQIMDWFRALGVNPIPALLSYAHPDSFDLADDRAVDAALSELVAELPKEEKLAILYLFYGDHGSSPSSIIQLIMAHLHNPLKDRIAVASNIVTTYEINKRAGNLIGEGYPLPSVPMLGRAIEAAIVAVSENKSGYVADIQHRIQHYMGQMRSSKDV